MSTPNLFILYVEDAAASQKFYTDLLGQDPENAFPSYVAFKLPGGTYLSLWQPHDFDLPVSQDGNRFEVAFMIEGDGAVDALFQDWKAKGITIAQEPVDAIFGRTFVAIDPDGHRLRVCQPD